MINDILPNPFEGINKESHNAISPFSLWGVGAASSDDERMIKIIKKQKEREYESRNKKNKKMSSHEHLATMLEAFG